MMKSVSRCITCSAGDKRLTRLTDLIEMILQIMIMAPTKLGAISMIKKGHIVIAVCKIFGILLCYRFYS